MTTFTVVENCTPLVCATKLLRVISNLIPAAIRAGLFDCSICSNVLWVHSLNLRVMLQAQRRRKGTRF